MFNVERLKELADLLKEGVITQEEFDKAKLEIMTAPSVPVAALLSQDEVLIGRIADYERISGILWIAIGIVQILMVYTAIAGIWNIFAGISRLNIVGRIRARDVNIPPVFEGITQLAIIGIINLLFGAVIGIVFVAFDFFIRDKILTNRHLFDLQLAKE